MSEKTITFSTAIPPWASYWYNLCLNAQINTPDDFSYEANYLCVPISQDNKPPSNDGDRL